MNPFMCGYGYNPMMNSGYGYGMSPYQMQMPMMGGYSTGPKSYDVCEITSQKPQMEGSQKVHSEEPKKKASTGAIVASILLTGLVVGALGVIFGAKNNKNVQKAVEKSKGFFSTLGTNIKLFFTPKSKRTNNP